MLNEKNLKNIKNILQMVQMKHLKDFENWGINKRKKETAINSLINIIQNDGEKLDYFKEWISIFTIDGHNNYYVFNYNDSDLELEDLKNIVEDIVSENLLEIDTSDLEETKVIYKKNDVINKRLIIRFISPALISCKNENENIESGLEKTFYFATLFLDLSLKQIIVSIPHTVGIKSIDNIEAKARDFSEIAKYYVSKLEDLLTTYNIQIEKYNDWIYDATYELAEEGSAHNNPEINKKYEENIDKIDEFAKKIAIASGITDKAIIENFKEGVGILYENILIDEFGVVEDENQYSTFVQNGDGVNSYCRVGSKTATLKSGKGHAIAKTSRNNEDVKNLGVMKSFNGTLSRFLIEVLDKELYLIRTDTSKFIEERVIYDVIRKVGEYKYTFRKSE